MATNCIYIVEYTISIKCYFNGIKGMTTATPPTPPEIKSLIGEGLFSCMPRFSVSDDIFTKF